MTPTDLILAGLGVILFAVCYCLIRRGDDMRKSTASLIEEMQWQATKDRIEARTAWGIVRDQAGTISLLRARAERAERQLIESYDGRELERTTAAAKVKELEKVIEALPKRAKDGTFRYQMRSVCPFCKLPIWGEGWNPKTKERFYSHVRAIGCCNELGHRRGQWRQYGKTEASQVEA